MPVYSYVAMDAKGKTIKGIVDAETEKVAKAKLRKENKFPTSLKEVQEGEEKAVKGKGLSLEIDIRSVMVTVKAQDRAIATRQFAKRQRTWFRARMGGWSRVTGVAA